MPKGDDVILGLTTVETETCAAVVKANGEVLSQEKKIREGNLTQGNQYNQILVEFQQENIQGMVEQALNNSNMDPSLLNGIAVPLGPGNQNANNVGIDFAIALGNKFGVPVIPVSLLEAEVFAPRFLTEQKLLLKEKDVSYNSDRQHTTFPYLTICTTGQDT